MYVIFQWSFLCNLFFCAWVGLMRMIWWLLEDLLAKEDCIINRIKQFLFSLTLYFTIGKWNVVHDKTNKINLWYDKNNSICVSFYSTHNEQLPHHHIINHRLHCVFTGRQVLNPNLKITFLENSVCMCK